MNGSSPQVPDNSANDSDIIAVEGFTPQDLYQRREKIFTRYVGGHFQKLRFYTGWPLLVGYFLTPWVMWGERQAVLFDLASRQFHVFGMTFWPQDFWMLGLLLMCGAFALFTVTTVVGRLWCGYTCPQTVWTAIFMWAEQLAEGSRNQRMRLDTQPWSLEKLRKRGFKHAMWLGWAFLTGLTFVGYFTPMRELTGAFLTLDVAAIHGWSMFWTLFFTAATYVNAGWMREQVCIYMCPYARFQSAMIDRDTLIVSYDPARGEPRGSRKRNAQGASALGDCIDCQMCVQVCPTGIDIRDGLQYQCIGCAHCIDACNQVMAKMDYAPNLIGYTTLNALDGGPIRWLRGRSVGYALVLLVVTSVVLSAILTRAPLGFDILRDRGALYSQTDRGTVRNDYQLKLMNKTQHTQGYRISVLHPEGVTLTSSANAEVEGGGILDIPMVLESAQPVSAHTRVRVSVCTGDGARCVEEDTTFLAPVAGGAAR